MLFYATPGINADTMIAKDGRICKAGGQSVQTASGAAPYGDNENTWPGYKDPTSFPRVYQGKGKANLVQPILSLIGMNSLLSR
jgi:hypothetical protein